MLNDKIKQQQTDKYRICITGINTNSEIIMIIISIQESVYMEEQCLSRYMDVSEEELLAATRRENILNEWNGVHNKQIKHRQERNKKPS